MGQQRTQYALAKKVELLDKYATGNLSIASVADNAGLPVGTLNNWVMNEKAIRAAYAKEQKQLEKANGKTNNGSNGHAKPAVKPPEDDSPEPKLGLVGLTPLLERIVKRELDAQLPGLVKAALDDILSRKSAN